MTQFAFGFTLQEQLAEVEREIQVRRPVYTRMVTAGTMRQDRAEYRIAVMEAVAETLRGLIREERL